MGIFRVLEPFFHALSDGKIIRVTVAWVLRVLAVLGAVGGVFACIAVIGLGIKGSEAGVETHTAGLLIGAVLFALLCLAEGYVWAGVCFHRARTVLNLGDSHFTVLSILSILFRLNGELMFVTYSVLGVGGCLFVWITDSSLLNEIGPIRELMPFGARASAGFLGGIELGIIMLLMAFVGIVVSYALAELSIVLVEIALNTRGIPAIAGQSSVSPITVTPPVEVPRPASAPFASRTQANGPRPACKNCGAILETGTAFCAECGSATGDEWRASSAHNAVSQ